MEKVLIILRGLPGSGKSTFANMMWPEAIICEADQYHYLDGEYRFNPTKIKEAHQWCQTIARHLMNNGKPQVVVSNTSTTEKEMQSYLDMANEFGYRVVSLIVENRHGNSSVHNVPQETLKKMQDRFEIKLI
jgi:predicted kinase